VSENVLYCTFPTAQYYIRLLIHIIQEKEQKSTFYFEHCTVHYSRHIPIKTPQRLTCVAFLLSYRPMARSKQAEAVGITKKPRASEASTVKKVSPSSKKRNPILDVGKKGGPMPRRKKHANQILKIAKRQRRGGFAVPHTVFSRMIKPCIESTTLEETVPLHRRVCRDLHEMTEEWLKGLYRIAFANATLVGRRCRITGTEVDQAITTRMAGNPLFLRFYEKYMEDERLAIESAE